MFENLRTELKKITSSTVTKNFGSSGSSLGRCLFCVFRHSYMTSFSKTWVCQHPVRKG